MAIISSLSINAEEYSLVIAADTFTIKYEANNGEHIIYGSNDKPYVITTTNVMKNNYNQVQFSSGNDRDKGELESTIPGITKVVVDLGTSKFMNLTVIIGNDTIQPTKQDNIYVFSSDTRANYLYITNDSNYAASQSSITVYFTDGDAVSGVEDTAVSDKPTKIIQNNQLIIVKNNKYYTVTGQQL